MKLAGNMKGRHEVCCAAFTARVFIMDEIPTSAEVDRIATLGDVVIRNLQITQCYHELSLALTRRIGPHANWCTFATWASKQAGQTIRKEDLARALKRNFQQSLSTVQASEHPAAAPNPP